jgi:hypothetical protein
VPTTKRRKGLTQKQVGRKYGFRSGLEERTAAALAQVGVEYTFEEQKVSYVKPERKSKYTPDFIITTRPDGTPRDRPLIVETKGRFLTDDRQKHLHIRDQHPDLDIRFVFSNPNQRISKTSKTTYAAWCEQHGFQYAKEHIPQEWLEE